MNLKITLYGTAACHLCEQAFEITQRLEGKLGKKIEIVDIAGDDALEEKFGLIIPAIQVGTRKEILSWPFTLKSLQEFIGNTKQ